MDSEAVARGQHPYPQWKLVQLCVLGHQGGCTWRSLPSAYMLAGWGAEDCVPLVSLFVEWGVPDGPPVAVLPL